MAGKPRAGQQASIDEWAGATGEAEPSTTDAETPEQDDAATATTDTEIVKGARYGRFEGRQPMPVEDSAGGHETECRNCGGTVSPDYARVKTDSQGRLHACPDCATQNELMAGKAAGYDPTWAANHGFAIGGEDL